jgi:hypothetical protein
VPAHLVVSTPTQETGHSPKDFGEFSDHPGSGFGIGIDKSVLAISEPRRYRDKAHRKFVSSQACLVCGRQPSDPHHLRCAQPRALSRKVSDEFTVPLCRIHHREVHRVSDEAAWWKKLGVDPYFVAAALWAQTRPVRSAAEPPNHHQSTAAPTSTSDPTSASRSPDCTRNRKTKPIVAADAQNHSLADRSQPSQS